MEIQPSQIPGKASGVQLLYGDVVIIESFGGGGYGDPLERDVDLVKQDVSEGYISKTGAQERYGVLLVDGAVDQAGTKELRKELRSQRCFAKIRSIEADEYKGAKISGLMSTHLAERIGAKEGDMVEYVAKVGAPLQAWVKVVDKWTGYDAPLGPEARAILGVREGDSVYLRTSSYRS
jgi:N-methylhydantoinase B